MDDNGKESGAENVFPPPKSIPTRFSKDNQPANRGRKPGLAKMLASVTDVSRKQIEDTVKSIMFETTQEEAAQILSDKDSCLFVKACTMAALKSIERGDMTTIDQLVEWAYTKKREMKVDISGDIISRPLINTSNLSDGAKAEIALAYAKSLEGNDGTNNSGSSDNCEG